MKLIKSNDYQYIKTTGRNIIKLYPEVYTPKVIGGIESFITLNTPPCYKSMTVSEIRDISVYDYWMYGLATEEEFYLHFLDKTAEEKEQFITHMNRLVYMRHLNKKEDEHLLTNKYETYKLLKEYYKRDVIYIENNADYPIFEAFVEKHKDFVIKPVGMATSIGVCKKSLDLKMTPKEQFEEIIKSVDYIRKQYKWATEKGVIIEELIKQGKEMSVLHPESINSIRFTTIMTGNQVHIWYPVVRIGMGGNFLCCGAVGSILSGINKETGITETEGYNEQAEVFIKHPNTNICIKGIQIPKWKELCELAISLARKFHTLNYIGWDFVYNHNNEWCVMEANENGEFLSQIAYQTGQKSEFEKIIGWKPEAGFWWEGKYINKFEI